MLILVQMLPLLPIKHLRKSPLVLVAFSLLTLSSPAEGQEHVVPDPHFQSTEPSFPQTHPSILKPARRDTTTDHLGGRRRGESIGAMGKRVDFSLGMSSISSGDQFGDVFDDPVKPRLPTQQQARMNSPNRGSEDDASLSHTTSRDSAGGSKTHRNRFFSRTRSKMENSREGGVSLEDLEEGRNGRKHSIYDMPDIPEASGANSASRPEFGITPPELAHMQRVGTGVQGRIDPRTGIVSPQAVARDSALERGDLPLSSVSGVRREENGGKYSEMR